MGKTCLRAGPRSYGPALGALRSARGASALLLSAILLAVLGALGPACDDGARDQLRPHDAPGPTDASAVPGLAFIVAGEGAGGPGEIGIDEGGVAHVLVSLTKAPAGPLVANVALGAALTVSPQTLTFDSSNFNVPQSLTISAPQDDNVTSEITEATISASGVPDGKIAVHVRDDDTQVLVVEPGVLTVTEGATDKFTVQLGFAPAGDTVVTITSPKPGAATVAPAALTFTAANWSSPQTVTVTGVVDSNVADESVDLALSTAGLTDTAVSVTVTDKDILNISISPSSLVLTEGAAAKTFTVALTQQPAANLTVGLASNDVGAATVTPATLTFTSLNYATPQTVTVTPVSDPDTMNEAVTVTASAAALTSKDVMVLVKDDDVQDIQPSTTAVTVNEGATTTFTVRLPFDPVTPLTIDLRTSNPAAATVSPGSLTFTSADYATPRTVTVTGAFDNNTVAEGVALTLTSPGLVTRTVWATTVDRDTQAFVVTPGAGAVTESGTATLSVRLAFNPLADTTVTVASSDTTAMTVSPATLLFTAWNYANPQAVTLSGVKNAGTADRAVNVTASAPGIASAVVPVTVVDVDVQSLSIAPTSLTLTEGGATGTIAVKLTRAPAADVTVSLASQNTAVATVSPATLTFTPANFATPQSATLWPVHDANAVTDVTALVVSAPGLTTQTVTVTVADADVQALIVTPTTLSVVEGATSTFTVRLAFAPTAPTSVSVTSSNGLAASVLSTSLTFTPANYAAPQTVTVAGVPDANTTAETVVMTVATTGVGNGAVLVRTVDTTAPACDAPATLPLPSSGNHNAGLTCIQSGCHTQARGSLPGPMTIGGTLFTSLAGGTPVAQATIHVVDANNVDVKISTAQNGNFWSTQAIAFPIRLRASKCPNIDKAMGSSVASNGGSCNFCHGNGNRIHLP